MTINDDVIGRVDVLGTVGAVLERAIPEHSLLGQLGHSLLGHSMLSGAPVGPLTPSHDPFLHAPADLSTYAPGVILRSRSVEVAMFGLIPQQVSAWQLVYRSTDLHGNPEIALTTVLLPADADPAADRPFLAFQSAVDAVTDRCAPSYVLRRGAVVPGSITQLEWPLIANALRRGWAVGIADHEGIHGRFGAPREPGYRALDGVRAALRFAPLGLHPRTPVAAWGYSGGGMASSWMVEMAPTYAPELNIVGAVLGAPVGDPGEVFQRLNGGRYAGLPAIVIAALLHVYPALGTVLDNELTPEGKQLIARASRMAPIPALPKLAFCDMSDYLTRPIGEILAEPPMRAMLEELRLGNIAPQCPLLVIQPVHDQIIATAGVDAQVERYRRGGATVSYLRDRLSDHFSLLLLGTPMTLDWLADRIAGLPVTDTTTKTVWSIAASRRGWRGLTEMLSTATRVVLGRPLRAESEPVSEAPQTLAA